MRTINLSVAKTHLSQLVEEAASGEAFIIAKGGKPLVKVVPIDTPVTADKSRIGFLKGHIRVPDDFDTLGASEIEAAFEGQ